MGKNEGRNRRNTGRQAYKGLICSLARGIHLLALVPSAGGSSEVGPEAGPQAGRELAVRLLVNHITPPTNLSTHVNSTPRHFDCH